MSTDLALGNPARVEGSQSGGHPSVGGRWRLPWKSAFVSDSHGVIVVRGGKEPNRIEYMGQLLLAFSSPAGVGGRYIK